MAPEHVEEIYGEDRTLQWLNYHGLLHFWTAVREGGIQAASRRLNPSHPTVSVQIKQLEESLGHPLFDRRRRKLELTDAGQVAFWYAEEIFALGRDLLEPALCLESPVCLSCVEDRFDRLLGSLATHSLDVLLADAPCPPGSGAPSPGLSMARLHSRHRPNRGDPGAVLRDLP